MDVLVCAMALIPVKFAELVLVLVFCRADHGWRCFEFYSVHCQNFFWCLRQSTFYFAWLAAATPPIRKVVVTLIISSTDIGMLSFNFLIQSGLVILCMNPDILMHSGAPLTCMLSALNLSMKASVGSPMPSYVFTLTGMRVLFGTSKFRILAVNGSVSSHSHGWESSLVRVYGLRLARFSADLLVLLLLFTYLCRGATLGLSHECMLLLLSPNCLKTFLSSGSSLVNTMALTGLLRRVSLSLLCLSLENTLAVCEGRVPLEAVTGLCLLFLGLFFLSHDSDSENWVCEFRYFPKPIRKEVPRIVVGCLLAPLVAIFWTVELAGVWAGFAGYTSRGAVGVWPSWILPGPGLGPLLVVWPKPAVRLVLYVINAQPYS
ncbi:hypothetical protein Tco_0848169 [Tanacetum coccineum]